MARKIWALIVLLVMSHAFGYKPHLEFDHSPAPAARFGSAAFSALSFLWLAVGMMPYCMGISDSPHVTFGQKVGASLIYFGVPLCGFAVATSLRGEKSWLEAGLNVLLAQF